MIKKHIVTVLTLLITSVILLITAGLGTDFIVNGKANSVVYKSPTKIANIDVDNKTREDIQILLIDSINSWKNQSNIRFFLKEEEISFSLGDLQFLIDESITLTRDGDQSGLITKLTLENVKEYIATLTNEEIKWEAIINELTFPATYLLPLSKQFYLEEYFMNQEADVVLAQSVNTISNEEDALFLNKTIPLEKGNFSLSEWILSNKLVFKDSSTYTELSSAIYEIINQSNMDITERYISNQLPARIEIGYESFIDLKQNLDLKFYNPNNQKMKIFIETIGNQLTVQLIGKPFLYKYVVEKMNLQSFDYELNNQFSNQLRNNTKVKKSSGIKGQVVELHRLKLHPLTNEVVEQFKIVDSYFPVTEVWVNGLIDLNIENNE